MNYKTIISFGESNIEYILQKYKDQLALPNERGIVNAHISGIAFGYGMCTRFAFMAAVFYIAAEFVYHLELN